MLTHALCRDDQHDDKPSLAKLLKFCGFPELLHCGKR
jgi:hypothetical protein